MKKIIILIFSLSSLIYSQSFDGIGMSLAGNFSAQSRGINALAYNPANLALTRGNTFELNLFAFNAVFANNSFSLNNYNRYFTAEGNHGVWSNADKHAILDLISDDGLGVNFDINGNVLGFAFNNFAFAAQMVGQGTANLASNKKPFEIALFGENIGSDYSYIQPSQFEGSAFSAIKFSIGYAYPFPIKNILPTQIKTLVPELSFLSVGFAVNYYVGLGVVQSRKADVLMKRIPSENGSDEALFYDVHILARMAHPDSGIYFPGRGRSYDFGLSTAYGDQWDISLSFLNIGGSINWSQNTEQMVIHQSDSVFFYNNHNDKNAQTDIDTIMTTQAFTTDIPSMMRLGVAYRLQPDWMVSAEWQQGLDKSFGGSQTPKIGIATEYYVLNWLPLRSGFSIGGREGFQYGLGFGLDFRFFEFDFSYAMKNALWPTFSKGALMALGFKLKI